MYELLTKKENCCGCGACKQRCPKNAITMQADTEGFLYPKIDAQLCIECGLCAEVCNFSKRVNKKETSQPLPQVFAVKHKTDAVRMNSASGGFFTAVSNYVFEKGGVVYGAAFTGHFYLEHLRAENKEAFAAMRGSKYLQSNTEKVYCQVKADLENGRLVLFTGTSCQIDGLQGYLRKDYAHLVTCDIVCHGTPSPKLFADFVQYLEEKEKSKLTSVSFRDKQQGWAKQKWNCSFENGKSYVDSADLLVYKRLFYGHNILRPGCYICPYATLKKPADITMGDFWGIQAHMPDFCDEKGVSIILLHTDKGKEVFHNISHQFELQESNCKDCLQPNLEAPTPLSQSREQFWRDYHENGFSFIAKKYGSVPFSVKVKRKIKNLFMK